MVRAATTRIVLLCLLAVPLGAAASGAATLTFDPLEAVVWDPSCGDPTFTVEVIVDGVVDDIQGFTITIGFDPEVIQPTGVVEGSLLASSPPTFFWSNLGGDEVVDHVQIDAAPLGHTVRASSDEGMQTLAVIEFHAVAGGHLRTLSELEFEHVDFRNHANQSITIGAADGSVQVRSCLAPVEQTSWGRIKQLLSEAE